MQVITAHNSCKVGWEEHFNPNNTRHWSGYKAWHEYEDALLQFNIVNGFEQFPRLLLPVIFIDEYLRDKSRNRMNLGISFSLANFSTEVRLSKTIISYIFLIRFKVYMKHSSKFCLCTTGATAPYHEVVKHVIINPLKKLEKGDFECWFYPTQSHCNFYGGLLCIIGDDIGARESLCRLGPTSKTSSRFFDQKEASFDEVIHPNGKVWKNVEQHRKLVKLLSALNVHVCFFKDNSTNNRQFVGKKGACEKFS